MADETRDTDQARELGWVGESDVRLAGSYPPSLRLGASQDRALRRWPLARIRPKTVALGVRSLIAEVDALRYRLAVAEAQVAEADRALVACQARCHTLIEALRDALTPPP